VAQCAMDEAPWRGAAGDARAWTQAMHAPRAVVEASTCAENMVGRAGWKGCKEALRAVEVAKGLNGAWNAAHATLPKGVATPERNGCKPED